MLPAGFPLSLSPLNRQLHMGCRVPTTAPNAAQPHALPILSGCKLISGNVSEFSCRNAEFHPTQDCCTQRHFPCCQGSFLTQLCYILEVSKLLPCLTFWLAIKSVLCSRSLPSQETCCICVRCICELCMHMEEVWPHRDELFSLPQWDHRACKVPSTSKLLTRY